MIGFQLGREYKLSIAEILAVFPMGKTVYLSNDFLILDNIEKEKVLEKANALGGTIKIIEIIDSTILEEGLKFEGKFKYGLSIFGEKKNLKDILVKQKKELKESNISSRFVNKDFQNLSSSQILGENLVKTQTDFNYIFYGNFDLKNDISKNLEKIYSQSKYLFGKTIWVQDIYNYSKRDYSKDRDMQTGMLPPKLCQMMINIANTPLLNSTPIGERKGQVIYDPFVGLGTILIESVFMGNKSIYGSDLNEKMVEITISNINKFCVENSLELENFEIEKLNAKFIEESSFFEKGVNSIITEGYLGEVMTQKNISIDRIEKQKKSLLELYDRFFTGLQKLKYNGNIVICFPFWEIKGKYIYFNEIYELLNKYCFIKKLFPEDFSQITTTKSGSLLYKRDKQLVGREIFKLTIKPKF